MLFIRHLHLKSAVFFFFFFFPESFLKDAIAPWGHMVSYVDVATVPVQWVCVTRILEFIPSVPVSLSVLAEVLLKTVRGSRLRHQGLTSRENSKSA